MLFPNRPDANRAVQALKTVRYWKCSICKVAELYYPCTKNKGADQLRSHCEADLSPCLSKCKMFVVSWGGSYGDPQACDPCIEFVVLI